MNKKDKNLIIIGITAALLVGTFLAPLASVHPDGLERVAEDAGFIDKATSFFDINFLIPDYAFPGIESSFWQTALAGIAGVIFMAAIFFLIYILVYFIGKKRNISM